MKSLSRHLLRRAARPLALCLAVFVPRPALALPLVQQPTSAEVEVLKQQALAEAEAGQVDAAIRDYGRVLSISPDWKEGWWNLGTLQYGANRFSEAKTSFGRVVAFAPAFGTAWGLLGLSEFETGDFAASLTHLEKAQALGHDDDPEIRRVSAYHLALLLLRSGAFERVSDLLLTTFGQGTPSPQVTYALGLALLRVPLLPAEIDPSLEATIMAAGDLATRPETSLARFPAFLATHPELPYAHYAYGLALSKAGRNPEALAQMQLETRLSPNSPLPWLAISRIESQLGDPAKAQAAAAQAEAARTQALAPGVPEPPEERIRLRYALAGATSPPSSTHAEDPSLWASAMAHYTASQYAPAVSDLKQWLQTHPVDGTAWAVLGLSEFALGDLGSAQLHLTRGETLGFSGTPTAIATARYTLAILLLRAGDFDHASHLLEQSHKPLDPKSRVRARPRPPAPARTPRRHRQP